MIVARTNFCNSLFCAVAYFTSNESDNYDLPSSSV